jgi:hypothetical protein
LEYIAETVLLKEMKRTIRKRLSQPQAAAVAASFLALQSKHQENDAEERRMVDNSACLSSLSVLLGKGDEERVAKILDIATKNLDDDNYLRGIIRQNAFGPDFHHYSRMEQEIRRQTTSNGKYHRILGMYPLAAMINHSCTTNATRTFVTVNGNINLMIATATQDIPSGHEILWSYIPPTSDYASRQASLQHYGFVCQCKRCLQDAKIDMTNLTTAGISSLLPSNPVTMSRWNDILQLLQTFYDNNSVADARSVRLAHTQLYIRYFNETLAFAQQQQPEETNAIYQLVLDHATQLHWSFCILHNASTEHISIVHLCYELASKISKSPNANSHDINNNNNNSHHSTVFWMDQLKRVHKCRYSSNFIANHGKKEEDLETLRTLLQHTRLVLRTTQGWEQTKFRFI